MSILGTTFRNKQLNDPLNLRFIIGSVLVTLIDILTSYKYNGLSHIDGDYCMEYESK